MKRALPCFVIATLTSIGALLPGCLATFDPARLEPPGCDAPLQSTGDFKRAYRDSNCELREATLDGSRLVRFERMVGDRTITSEPPFDSDAPGIGWVNSVFWSPVLSQARALFTDGHHVTHVDGTVVEVEGETASFVFAGAHHAIYEISWTVEGIDVIEQSGPVVLTVQWFFAGGRDHPVYAITYDLSGIAANAYNGDARAPYGDLFFAGDGTPPVISGVGWGDELRFVTRGEPLQAMPGDARVANGWSYEEPNTVPYSMTWATDADAELGLVQTERYARHPAGGGSATPPEWNEVSEEGPMPQAPDWPYTLMQYNFAAGQTTTSPRIGWGSSQGAVGQQIYGSYGRTAATPYVGHPTQSYSTFVVLGQHSADAVLTQVEDVETSAATTLLALRGTLAATALAGAGRTDEVTLVPPGWDPRLAAWRVAADDADDLRIEVQVPAGRTLRSPVFVIEGISEVTRVTVGGRALRADELLVSPSPDLVFVTLRTELEGEVVVEVEGGG